MSHDIIANCIDNTDLDNLGIFWFAKNFFANRFSYPFAPVHFEMAKLLLKLLDPTREYVMQRQAYLMVHREAAKSTVCSFLFPIYLTYMKGHTIYIHADILGWDQAKREEMKHMMIGNAVPVLINENFIVIASETSLRATSFVSSIKAEIEQRNDLARIFGEKDPRIIVGEEDRRKSNKLWRVNSFITSDGTVLWALGAGQQTRGMNVNGHRPSLIIVDDMYSQRNTKTEENRAKLNNWFTAELINSADSRDGKVLLLGTLVNPDTVFTEVKQSANWFGIERPIISLKELQASVAKCMSKDKKMEVPDIKTCKKWEKDLYTLSWKEHKGLYYILNKYYESLGKRNLSGFYQEWMNEPIAPETMNINRDSFVPTHMDFYKQENRQMIEFRWNNLQWIGVCSLYVGVDPASSIANTADDTAIVVSGFARCVPRAEGFDWQASAKSFPNGKVFPIIAHIEGGKYAITDYQSMPGMAEALLRLDQRYKLDWINIELAGQQEQMIREISKIFGDYEESYALTRKRITGRTERRRTTIWAEPTSAMKMNKAERILSILMPICQNNEVILYNSDIKKIDLLFEQVLTVGIGAHDDYADAWAISMKKADKPDLPMHMVGLPNKSPSRLSDRYSYLHSKIGDDAWMFL